MSVVLEIYTYNCVEYMREWLYFREYMRDWLYFGEYMREWFM